MGLVRLFECHRTPFRFVLRAVGSFCTVFGHKWTQFGLKFSALDVADQVRTEYANLQ
jgi:hypothetical protein